jgi:hypothetical protein
MVKMFVGREKMDAWKKELAESRQWIGIYRGIRLGALAAAFILPASWWFWRL